MNYPNTLNFRQDHTPVVNLVSPPYGDIFGGYNLTIVGDFLNFSTPTIYIDDVYCDVLSINNTQIICAVGTRYSSTPLKNNFSVIIGTSKAVLHSSFVYVFKWSDYRTWGVDLPPVDGDLVFVPAGMNLLVDQSTPHLLGITAQDGTIIFSNDTDVTVYTGFLTMNGGTLIAGT